MSDEIERLTPEMTGTYLVRTQGSEHVWDLDAETYERRQGRPSHPSMTGFPNDVPIPWFEVSRWPEVGRSFLVYLRMGTGFDWHQSSTIRSIEKVSE